MSPRFDVNAVRFTSYQTFQEKPFDTAIDRKVVLEVDAKALLVSKPELRVVKKIAGTRFKGQTLKLVTMRHPTVAENKRELLELLYNLVGEAKAIVKAVQA